MRHCGGELEPNPRVVDTGARPPARVRRRQSRFFKPLPERRLVHGGATFRAVPPLLQCHPNANIAMAMSALVSTVATIKN
jgi:hypothetical protein